MRAQNRPAWVDAYMAIPFVEGGRDRDGADCYGMVRLVLAERFGVEIPKQSAGAWTSDLDRRARDDLAARVRATLADWHDIPRGSIKAGDVLLLLVAGRPLHVGVALDGEGLFFHTELDVGPHCDDWNGARWSRRVLGFYRWGAVK